jgi:hypothetical protein
LINALILLFSNLEFMSLDISPMILFLNQKSKGVKYILQYKIIKKYFISQGI